MSRSTLAMTGLTVALAFGSLHAQAAPGDALSQQNPDQWRASKLVGVQIYGPNQKSVGKISDVLMSKEGHAGYVVIGVGGFLGIGEKDVAIPFDQVKFTDQPIIPPANPVAPGNNMAATAPAAMPGTTTAATTTNGMAPNGGVAPGATVGLGTPGADLTNAVPAAGPMPHSTAYPDHGTIDMTADQLKSAPTFHFAS